MTAVLSEPPRQQRTSVLDHSGAMEMGERLWTSNWWVIGKTVWKYAPTVDECQSLSAGLPRLNTATNSGDSLAVHRRYWPSHCFDGLAHWHFAPTMADGRPKGEFGHANPQGAILNLLANGPVKLSLLKIAVPKAAKHLMQLVWDGWVKASDEPPHVYRLTTDEDRAMDALNRCETDA